MKGLAIRPARATDATAIAAIYAPYVADTAITFELDPPDAAEIARRMADGAARFPWLVGEIGGAAIGYALGYPYRARAAYRWVAETAIYLAPAQHKRGLGRQLYAALLDALTDYGYVAAIGAIALPNGASVRLHEHLDFEHVGTQRQIGFKHGAWRDVGFWQIDLAPRRMAPAEPAQPR